MKKHILLVLVLLLNGCASAPKPVNVQLTPEQHQQQLKQLQKWRLQGKLAFISKEEKFSANLDWRQSPSDFAFNLSNFLGVNLLHMSGKDNQVQLQADDQQFVGNDASELIYRASGWNIPVEQLTHWVKGQSLASDVVTHSTYGWLENIKAPLSGWQIHYNDYRNINGRWLPHNLTLTYSDLRLKIRIHQWQFL